MSCCSDTSSLGPSCPENEEEDLDATNTEQEGFVDLTDELASVAADDQASL